uniref:Uncharacterized protein n=1 Tax=Heterorhabditis bacteriophora TaxID=37862 RepID=A0A1I7WF16_HETBA
MLNYDFDIQYRSTTTFGQADALSRLISSVRYISDALCVSDLSYPIKEVQGGDTGQCGCPEPLTLCPYPFLVVNIINLSNKLSIL